MMISEELESQFGRSIKPKELADFLGIDRRTVIKYADLWGGVQVSPGRYRFFENRIKEILNAWLDNETREKALEGQHHGRGPTAAKAVPRRIGRNVREGSGMGGREKDGAGNSTGKEPNCHGLLDDPIMV